jgi:hypothetical protein
LERGNITDVQTKELFVDYSDAIPLPVAVREGPTFPEPGIATIIN